MYSMGRNGLKFIIRLICVVSLYIVYYRVHPRLLMTSFDTVYCSGPLFERVQIVVVVAIVVGVVVVAVVLVVVVVVIVVGMWGIKFDGTLPDHFFMTQNDLSKKIS